MSRSIIDGRELDTGENDVYYDCPKCSGVVSDNLHGDETLLTCSDCHMIWEGNDFELKEIIDCDLTDPKCLCEDCTHERTTTWKMD